MVDEEREPEGEAEVQREPLIVRLTDTEREGERDCEGEMVREMLPVRDIVLAKGEREGLTVAEEVREVEIEPDAQREAERVTEELCVALTAPLGELERELERVREEQPEDERVTVGQRLTEGLLVEVRAALVVG